MSKTDFLQKVICYFLRLYTEMRLDRVGGVAAASLVSVLLSKILASLACQS